MNMIATVLPVQSWSRSRICLAATGIGMLLLAGCAGNLTRAQLEPSQFLHDEAFPQSSSLAVESREDVFKLDEETRIYLDRKIGSIRDHRVRGRALLDEMFHQASLNLSYESNANTTASETFRARNANCLSLSILAYAMAEHLGFDARFQEVDVPEYWERRDNFSLMNRHVNLKITPKVDSGTTVIRKVELEVDFQPIAGIHNPPSRTISQSRVLAMFYNNKGVDALLAGKPETAYAYLKAAILQDPSLDMALTNLGLLYGINGHLQWAEESLRQANRINRNNPVAAENLALILKRSNRQHEADVVLARLERQRQNNPYYLYIQGEEAYDAGNWQQAIRFFEKAINLKPDVDAFYFGMARTYARLGDAARAESNLRRAERYADYEDLKERYRSAIAGLTKL